VANKNVPNMLSQILSVLAEADHNVEDMVNRHRDGFAYNIIDLAAECISEETLKAVGDIEGVVMTRMICRET
jgi:D-3-phosphoglycerate dehydrogenase